MKRKKSYNVPIFVPHGGCPYRCVFCDQRGISGEMEMPTDSGIARLLTDAAESLGEKAQHAQVAFFGGSFTAIPHGEMVRLLEAVQPFLRRNGGVFSAVRVSTRPDAVDGEVLDILLRCGVEAVELGAQTMDDRVLAACGRGHTARDVADASRLIRERGLSLGLQMMTGLPGSDDETDLTTARTLARLKPDTVRVYPSLVLEGTALARMWRAGDYRPQGLDDAVALCAGLLELFTEAGIRVIRMGLHDTVSLRDGVLAGPHHPAFRELCESRILLKRAFSELEGVPKGDVCLYIQTGSASKIVGQCRCNIKALREHGYRVKIRETNDLPYLDVRAFCPA